MTAGSPYKTIAAPFKYLSLHAERDLDNAELSVDGSSSNKPDKESCKSHNSNIVSVNKSKSLSVTSHKFPSTAGL